MANGRCKRHGGKSTGPKTPNVAAAAKANTTFGIYSRHLSEDDQATYRAVTLGSVDEELRLVRVRLDRTVRARREWELSLVEDGTEAATDGDGSHVLVETVDDESVTKDGDVVPTTKKTRRLPDFDKIEHACLARIESLEKTRRELLKPIEGDPDGDPEGLGPTRDRVIFTGGLGGEDEEPPSPFDK